MTGRSTRERLIDAVFTVVARDGFDGASVKVIAAEAGVTPGLTHYHFPTKDDLLEAALREALDGYLEGVRARRLSTPPDQLVAAFFADGRKAVTTDADFFRVRLAFAVRALTYPRLAAVMGELNARAIAETALTFAAAAGRSAATERDLHLAAVMKAAFDGIMLACLTDPSFPIAATETLLADAARAWLSKP